MIINFEKVPLLSDFRKASNANFLALFLSQILLMYPGSIFFPPQSSMHLPKFFPAATLKMTEQSQQNRKQNGLDNKISGYENGLD